MTEVYVDAVSVLVTREQLDWLNAQVDPRHERGIAIRALIDAQMKKEEMEQAA